jgi:hypothetical protein
MLLVPVGTDIEENDHVTVNGQQYTVVANLAPKSVTAIVDRYVIREI